MPVKATVAKTSHSSSLAALVSTEIRRQFGSCGDSTALGQPVHEEHDADAR